MKTIKKDILGKEIETIYASSGEVRAIDNLQKQLMSLYLYMENKGLLQDEEFKDFAESRELAERIENINKPEEIDQPHPRSNSFSYIINTDDTIRYRDDDRLAPVGCSHFETRFIQDELTGTSYDLDDTDDIRKLVGEINKRLRP